MAEVSYSEAIGVQVCKSRGLNIVSLNLFFSFS